MSNQTKVRPAIYGLFFLFTLSLAFRVYLVFNESLPIEMMGYSLHGVLSDLVFPFAAMTFAAYTSKAAIYNFSQWFSFIFSLIVCCDFAFYLKTSLRLNKNNLINGVVNGWSLSEKTFLAAGFFLVWLAFFYLRKKLESSPEVSLHKPAQWLLIICSSVLLITNSYSPVPSLSTDKLSWDDFYVQTNSFRRVQLEKSSFTTLFTLELQEMISNPLLVFIESPYLEKFSGKFHEQKKEKIQKARQAHFPSNWRHMQNSVESAINSFENGFKGVEIDLNFDEDSHKLWVCHDPWQTYSRQSLISLEEFLEKIDPYLKQRIFLWLDLKNISYANQKKVIQRLKKVLRQKPYKEQIFIESRNQFMVRFLSQAGFNTIWGLFYGNSNARLESDWIHVIKGFAVLSGCDLISIPWQLYSEEASSMLEKFPLALYTVNDHDSIKKLKKNSDVTFLLTDLELKESE